MERKAVFKIGSKHANLPDGVALVALDADGYQLSNGWYLKLGGMIGKMLRGEIPTSADLSW